MSTFTLDVLLGRIVDRRDTPEDWEQLDVQADLDAQLWTELLARLRDDARCREAVQVAMRPAADVPLPRQRRRVRPALLAAAAILLGLVLGVQVGRPGREAAGPDAAPAALAGGPAPATTDPVVLDELPSLLLATRATGAEGMLEVVYLRRTLECRQVTTLYELQRDDAGVPAPLPVDSARLLTSVPF